MLLFILRHGDPIYNPDSLTDRGHLQAAALAKRLALYGLDHLYSSPMIRAQQTAHPTEILLGKTAQIEEWTSESLAYSQFSKEIDGKRIWIFQGPLKNELRTARVLARGARWYEDPVFEGTKAKEGCERLQKASDEFLARHGYRHDRENQRYIAERPNEERIAVFCHQGFGLSWLGTMLDIPLPIAWTSMNMSHTGMSVVEFEADENGLCTPMLLTLSNDSHLYREGYPTRYNNRLYF